MMFKSQQSATIKEAILIQHAHQMENSIKLEHIRDVLSITPRSVYPQLIHHPNNDPPAGQLQPYKRNSSQLNPRPVSTVHDTSHVRITTSLSTNTCDVTCPCQCHIKSHWRTPKWLSAVVGTLFYDSSYTLSAAELPCNSMRCARSQNSSRYNFTYYFPVWILRSSLVYTSWSNLSGTNSSWTIRMPRIIPWDHECWWLVEDNHISRLRSMLSERSITPYDVDGDGYSIFQVIQTFRTDHDTNVLTFH